MSGVKSLLNNDDSLLDNVKSKFHHTRSQLVSVKPQVRKVGS